MFDLISVNDFSIFALLGLLLSLGVVWRGRQVVKAIRPNLPSTLLGEAFFNHAPISIAIVSPSDKIWHQVNPHLAELLGYAATQLEGHTWQEVIHPDDYQWDELDKTLTAQTAHYSTEKRFVCVNGEIINTRFQLTCLHVTGLDSGYCVLILDNITEQKQAEQVMQTYYKHLDQDVIERTQALQTQQAHLSNTLQTLCSTQQDLIQAEKMFALAHLISGVAHELNTPLGVIRASIPHIEDFVTKVLLHWQPRLASQSPEQQALFKRWLEQAVSNAELSKSTVEKRRYKRALIGRLETLSDNNIDAEDIADTLVDTRLYEITDADLALLLNSMQIVNGYNLLETLYTAIGVYDSAYMIDDAADKAAKTIAALRHFVRFHPNSEPESVQIIEGIETVLTLYHHQLKQGIEIVRDYADNIPPILCYPDELNQVWSHLIHNALLAMPDKGRLTIKVTILDNKNMYIEWTHTGCSIPINLQKIIFEACSTTQTLDEGSSLGLHSVKKIIEQHQGSIQFESQAGHTCFQIQIAQRPVRRMN